MVHTNSLEYYLALLLKGKSPVEAWKLTRENITVEKSLTELGQQVNRLNELRSQGHGRESVELQVGTTITSNKAAEVEDKLKTHFDNLGERKV